MSDAAAAPNVESADRPRASTVLAVAATAFGVGAVAIDATFAFPVVLLAAVAVTVAVVRRRRAPLDLGVPLGLLGVLAHGALGGSALGTVAAAGLFVFAWDVTDHAFDLDAQLGSDARVVRGELAHAGYSFLVAALAGGGAYVIAFVAAGRRPLPSLVLLLLGAILLTAAVRDR